jgi:hypothetical protein
MSQQPTSSVPVDNMAAPHSPNQGTRPLDVPQNVDLAAEHWNDPNYDIGGLPTTVRDATDVGNAPARYTASDPNEEPQIRSRGDYDFDSTSNQEDEDNEYVSVLLSVTSSIIGALQRISVSRSASCCVKFR